ncbi:MAG TPA: ABC transporter permease [Chloroflexota bacterium]|nr:ABC transporter permease [Chloroflexota bacterium]
MIPSSSAPDAPASPSTPGASRLTSAWGASGAAARIGQTAVAVLAALLLLFIVLPLVALFLRTTPASLLSGLRDPTAVSALVLSLETTAITLALALVLGTPAAYLLARGQFPGKRLLDSLVDLPIVVPPAVAGVALLMAFGRQGLLGPALNALGIHLPFSTAAVVLAQLFVACPYYVRAARAGFLGVDRTLEDASATLGYGGWGTFQRVTVPLTLPALVGGAVLTWARALGEFGATIMFAGNLMGVTQTMPLAVYLGLESGDLDGAVALSVLLVLVSLLVLLVVRLLGD